MGTSFSTAFTSGVLALEALLVVQGNLSASIAISISDNSLQAFSSSAFRCLPMAPIVIETSLVTSTDSPTFNKETTAAPSSTATQNASSFAETSTSISQNASSFAESMAPSFMAISESLDLDNASSLTFDNDSSLAESLASNNASSLASNKDNTTQTVHRRAVADVQSAAVLNVSSSGSNPSNLSSLALFEICGAGIESGGKLWSERYHLLPTPNNAPQPATGVSSTSSNPTVFSAATTFNSCPANTYSPIAGATTCTSCPANTWSAAGATGCIANPTFYIGNSGTRFPSSYMTYTVGVTSVSQTINLELFTVTASSVTGTSGVTGPFDGTANGDWSPSGTLYSTANGLYTGSVVSVVDGVSLKGEWLQILFSTPRQLASYAVTIYTYGFQRGPTSFVIAGSNDGVLWQTVDNRTGVSQVSWTSNGQTQIFTLTNTLYMTFTSFRIIIMANGASSDGMITISEWALYSSIPTSCSPFCSTITPITYGHCSPTGIAVCCGGGQYFVEGKSTACQSCAAAMFANGNATTCTTCPINTYSPIAGSTTCTSCPANSWSATGSSACTANVGYYDLGSSLMAYYPFNPGNLLGDISGKLGSLTAPQSLPATDCTTASLGPGGNWASNCVYANQGNVASGPSVSTAQYFNMPSVTFPAAYSFCLWYMPVPSGTGSPFTYEFLFGFTQPTYLANWFYMQRNAQTSNIVLGVYSLAGSALLNWGGAYMQSNTWYHMCIAFSGVSYNLYYNGASVSSGSLAAAQDITSARTVNALFGGGGGGMQGKMDEVRIFNKQLSAAEVAAVYGFRGGELLVEDAYLVHLALHAAASATEEDIDGPGGGGVLRSRQIAGRH